MIEENVRICSTRNALSEMLATATRRLERSLNAVPKAPTGNEPSALDQAKAEVAQLTARLANHRTSHGC